MTLEHVVIVFQIIVFLFAISVHESAHAWVAYRNGDPTAYMLGRVTLNPIKHIDPIGTIALPLIAALTHLPLIGWAKPTPVDPRNFKNLVRSDILTSVAGPVSNILVAGAAVAAMMGISVFSFNARMAVHRMASNDFPEGSSLWTPLVILLYYTMLINVLLAIFNMIPIPPLDGSHVVRHFLPESARRAYDMIGGFGLIVLFLLGGRLLGVFLFPVIAALNSLLTRV